MRRIPGPKLIFLKERSKPRRRVLRKSYGFSGTHQEVSSECVPHLGKVGTIPNNLIIGKYATFIVRDFKLVELIQLWY